MTYRYSAPPATVESGDGGVKESPINRSIKGMREGSKHPRCGCPILALYCSTYVRFIGPSGIAIDACIEMHKCSNGEYMIHRREPGTLRKPRLSFVVFGEDGPRPHDDAALYDSSLVLEKKP